MGTGLSSELGKVKGGGRGVAPHLSYIVASTNSLNSQFPAAIKGYGTTFTFLYPSGIYLFKDVTSLSRSAHYEHSRWRSFSFMEDSRI